MSSRYTNSSRYEYQSSSKYNDDDREEFDFESLQRQTKDTRKETTRVLDDTLSRMRTTEDTAAKTMMQLQSQSEHLYKAKRDLNLAKTNQEIASTQVAELKRLNTFFAFKNPFKSSKKLEKKLQEEKLKTEYESKVRHEVETRRQENLTKQRLQQKDQYDIYDKYSKEDIPRQKKLYGDLLDDEDVEDERKIESSLTEMGDILGRLKSMATGMGEEIAAQNGIVDKLGRNADDMNVRIGMTSNRMKKF